MLHGRLLRYLDEVARAGSIRRASARLNVAASAINRQILTLEEELGAPVFERMAGRLRLTATGEIVIAHVRETLREHERALGRIEALRGLMRGEVTLATMGGLAAGVLGEAIAAFRAAHPRVRLHVRVLPREGLVQAVLAGEADLGLAYNVADNPRLFRVATFEHQLGAVAAPDHPLLARTSLRIADCVAYPMVVADRTMSLRDVLELLLPPTLDLAPVVETNSLELMKRLARRGPHVTFLNLADVVEEVRDGRLGFVPLQGAAARQSVALVQRAKGALDPSASVVAQHIIAAFADEAAA